MTIGTCMRILNVLDFSPEFPGGMVRLLEALGRSAEAVGHEILVAFPRHREWQSELGASAKVQILPEITRPLRSGFPNALRSVCEKEAVDMMHFHFSFALPFSLTCSPRLWRTPSIYHWHNPPKPLCLDRQDGRSLKTWVTQQIPTFVARLTDNRVIDLHIAISEEIRELLISHRWAAREKIELLRNGVSIPGCTQNRAGPENGAVPIVGSVASFRPQKDHDTLVRAFHRLTEMGTKAELWLVGDGPTRPAIERLVSELGLAGRVCFLGTVANAQDLYSRFTVFVLSTNYEGHPLVLLEAMAHGLPIVATSTSSIPEIVTHSEEALLVSPRRPAELAAALQAVLTDSQLRSAIGANACARVKRDHDISNWSGTVINCYERLYTKKHLRTVA